MIRARAQGIEEDELAEQVASVLVAGWRHGMEVDTTIKNMQVSISVFSICVEFLSCRSRMICLN